MDNSDFDFRQVSEEKEELDFNKLVTCPNCKKPIPHDATMCLYCGGEVFYSKKPAWFVWVVGILIVSFILFCAFVI